MIGPKARAPRTIERFNLDRDPNETTNLTANLRIVAELTGLMQQAWRAPE